jgi:hypothetical protein
MTTDIDKFRLAENPGRRLGSGVLPGPLLQNCYRSI